MRFYGLQSGSTYFRNNFTFINASKQSPKIQPINATHNFWILYMELILLIRTGIIGRIF